MISKEEYEKASDVVTRYNQQKNMSLIQNRICACCKSFEIKPLKDTGLDSGSISPLEQEMGCWDGGVVEKINFGYGSRIDMESYYIAICDDCIVELEKDGYATNLREIRKKMKDDRK